MDLDQIASLLSNPPTLWTVIKARVTVFAVKLDKDFPMEKFIDTQITSAAKILRKCNFHNVNCRIIIRKQVSITRRQLLGLVKNRLQQNGINLQFHRGLPEIILSLNASQCRGYLEIGRSFAYPNPLQVHHTPLSPVVSYALFHLARQIQPGDSCNCLDPMCGNGTILLVGKVECVLMKVPFIAMGIDKDPTAIANARENLQSFPQDVFLSEGAIEHFDFSSLPVKPNMILTHPPYGFAPVLEPRNLEILYESLFRLFSEFPASVYGIVTPHQPLILKLVKKYQFKTEILRPFRQKTLPAFLWVGHSSQK